MFWRSPRRAASPPRRWRATTILAVVTTTIPTLATTTIPANWVQCQVSVDFGFEIFGDVFWCKQNRVHRGFCLFIITTKPSSEPLEPSFV